MPTHLSLQAVDYQVLVLISKTSCNTFHHHAPPVTSHDEMKSKINSRGNKHLRNDNMKGTRFTPINFAFRIKSKLFHFFLQNNNLQINKSEGRRESKYLHYSSYRLSHKKFTVETRK
jgi:hypothetical protein